MAGFARTAARAALLKRALAISEKVLSPEHPNTNRVRHSFARLLLAEGNAAEALRCAEAALAVLAEGVEIAGEAVPAGDG